MFVQLHIHAPNAMQERYAVMHSTLKQLPRGAIKGTFPASQLQPSSQLPGVATVSSCAELSAP